MAVGRSVRTSHRAAREPMPSPMPGRWLEVAFSPGTMSGERCQRQSRPPGQCRPPPLAYTCRGFAKTHRSRLDAVGRRGRSSASPHLDSPTFVGNLLRCFHWLKLSRRLGLLLVPLVLCVHIRACVGATGLHATLGGDHPDCMSLSQAFPLFLLSTNTAGISSTSEAFFHKVSSSLGANHEGQELLSASNSLFHSFIVCLLPSRCVSRGKSLHFVIFMSAHRVSKA